MTQRSADELLDIVDEQDRMVGQARRAEAYARRYGTPVHPLDSPHERHFDPGIRHQSSGNFAG